MQVYPQPMHTHTHTHTHTHMLTNICRCAYVISPGAVKRCDAVCARAHTQRSAHVRDTPGPRERATDAQCVYTEYIQRCIHMECMSMCSPRMAGGAGACDDRGAPADGGEAQGRAAGAQAGAGGGQRSSKCADGTAGAACGQRRPARAAAAGGALGEIGQAGGERAQCGATVGARAGAHEEHRERFAPLSGPHTRPRGGASFVFVGLAGAGSWLVCGVCAVRPGVSTVSVLLADCKVACPCARE